MKLIIAGGRDFEDKDRAVLEFKEFQHELNRGITREYIPVTEIVSGGARGADRVGEYVALLHRIPVKKFIPDWNGLGKKAGHVRNAEMGDYADALLAFWDGKSKGTQHMINYARKKGLKVKVVYY